ncbi:MAG: glycerol-3-phosphate dehydrogenase/oxidase [Bacteroidota bacterium]
MTSTPSSFSSLDRTKLITSAEREVYELIVIGGGVTGCGIALDAASRGLKTLLVEKSDFAAGTSSKSTKLIHGGLRYLKQLEIGLVRESGLERAVVNKLAPHLCLPEKMLLPLTEDGTFGKYSTSLGLWVYDKLANVEGDDRRVMLSREETISREPLLKTDGLKGSGYYAEYRTDDARLTIELVKKACAYGCTALSYMEVVDFIYEDGRISGVKTKDHISEMHHDLRSTYVVSAGGPWVDRLRDKNNSLSGKRLHLTKGVHIVVPFDRLPIRQSVYFDIPDGRMAFAIPRGRVTYIGTTDTEYHGSLDRIVATEQDRDYLLKAVNNVFSSPDLTQYDVISNWAGLRPLIHEDGKSPSELSRKDEIFESEDGLISIAGGKLTGYRKMAERIVDKVRDLAKHRGSDIGASKTKSISLTQRPLTSNDEVESYIVKMSEEVNTRGLESYYGWYLVTNYGTAAEKILQSLPNDSDREVALALSEVDFCVREEMLVRAEDFFVRRTGRLYFDILTIDKIMVPVMDRMATTLGWSAERKESEQKRLDILLQDATTYYKEEFALQQQVVETFPG